MSNKKIPEKEGIREKIMRSLNKQAKAKKRFIILTVATITLWVVIFILWIKGCIVFVD